MDELKEAILSNDLAALDHLLFTVDRTYEQNSELAALAARTGSRRCLEVLGDWFIAMDDRTWHFATYAGQLHILHFLQETSPETRPIDVADFAAAGGSLECLRFLRSVGCGWNVHTAYMAASGGHQDCLTYLIDSGCPIDASTTYGAAGDGHIGCLTYLRSRGCPWDARSTDMAASEGHFPCLKYAVENNCPVGDSAFASAIQHAHLRCLEFLFSAGHRPESPLKMHYLHNDHQIPCVEFAKQKGVSFHTGQLVLAASVGNLKLVRLLHIKGQVPWQRAIDVINPQHLPQDHTLEHWAHYAGTRGSHIPDQDTVWGGVLHLSPSGENLRACWGTLRFGSLHGAPLTPRAQAIVDERRTRAQEVVRCFHTAQWRIAAGGPEAGKWDAMSRLPEDVLLSIMELAEVEIKEAGR